MHPSRNQSACLVLICFLAFVLLYRTGGQSESNLKCIEDLFQKNGLYRSWRQCIMPQLSPNRGNHTKFWLELEPLATACNQPYASILSIKDYANSDEVKHHIAPLMNISTNTIVTLGIGHDIGAEEKLIEAMGTENLQFFGADPVQEINKDLYNKIGSYYPVAVAAKAGYASADVLEVLGYQRSSVLYVDAVYFLTKMIGLKFYDDLWIDSEGGEYEMLQMIVKGGSFDQNDITVCQFNMEMHMPDEPKQKLIHDFLFQMLDDQRYAFFFAINVGHLRIFFVNFSDEKCVQKYIPQEFDGSQLCK